MHACDRRTDGQTDRITTPKTAVAYGRAVKKRDHAIDALAQHNINLEMFVKLQKVSFSTICILSTHSLGKR